VDQACLDDSGTGVMDENQIKQWAASPHATQQIAAEFARKIASGQLARWDELPRNAETADDYGVSIRTVGRAKKLLADQAIITKAGGVYVVAWIPAQATPQTANAGHLHYPHQEGRQPHVR
jgi:DNA-binding GntR family transcriptional regulator